MNFSMMTNTTADSTGNQQQGAGGSFEPQPQAPVQGAGGNPSSNPFEGQAQGQDQFQQGQAGQGSGVMQ